LKESVLISRRRLIAAPLLALPFVSRAATTCAQAGDQTAELQTLIDQAQTGSGRVALKAGTYHISGLSISGSVQISGVPGHTTLRINPGGEGLVISKAKRISLEGLGIVGKGVVGDLVRAEDVSALDVDVCSLAGGGSGLRLSGCGGAVRDSQFAFHQAVAIHALDSQGLRISGNRFSDIGNNAIQVWRSDKGPDGTIVSENHISRIAAEDGGDGQNGNAINIYKAGQVIVANNHISDCAFTGIRNNASDGSIITGNSISRCNEVGLYVEFGFLGANVSNNILQDVAHGISITNFNEGGRLAVCQGNIIRRARGVNAHGEPLGGGIAAEADCLISGNLIEDAEGTGISLGWGKFGRNLSAQGNTLRNVGRGITFSALAPGPFMVANNMILGARTGAVLAMDHNKVVSEDLTRPGARLPDSLLLTNTVVRDSG
jgi:uncharacterized secreted repeat protein (TIGR03808 family)